MLVSHPYQFIYVKSKKTGGTSIEVALQEYCVPGSQLPLRHTNAESGIKTHVTVAGVIGARLSEARKYGGGWWNHMTASEIRSAVGDRLWDNYLTITVVRSPYEKVLSQFFYVTSVDVFPEAGRYSLNTLENTRRAFEHWLMSPACKLWVDNGAYLINGEMALDCYLRHEALEADYSALCERLGVTPRVLPRLKGGHRKYRDAPTSDFYTPAMLDKVRSAYSTDFDLIGYDTDPRSLTAPRSSAL